MVFRIFISSLALMGVLGVYSSSAQAGQHQYAGPHPIAHKHGGGYCYIEFPHIHTYAPDKAKVMYRQGADGYFFVGDPVAHGYDGERHAYHGAHPIYVETAVVGMTVEPPHPVWCYIKGPHFHAVAPPTSATFEVKGDVNWYIGTYPPEFEAARPVAVQINAVYEPIRYERPVVIVQPPVAYVDVFVGPSIIVAPPVIGPPGIIVGAPPPFMVGGHVHGGVHGHGYVGPPGPFPPGPGRRHGHVGGPPGPFHGGPGHGGYHGGGHGGFKGGGHGGFKGGGHGGFKGHKGKH
ncbi:MAG: hypothetical protein MUC50_15215 [Myxococcota bacterium]|nr:hypothetical protein [Myxococcota bacterium]